MENDYTSEARVLRYKIVETESAKILIPLESQYNAYKSTIVESSLKINVPMADELFTLSPTHHGMYVYDNDTRKLDKPTELKSK